MENKPELKKFEDHFQTNLRQLKSLKEPWLRDRLILQMVGAVDLACKMNIIESQDTIELMKKISSAADGHV
jgi:hypothetical protein